VYHRVAPTPYRPPRWDSKYLKPARVPPAQTAWRLCAGPIESLASPVTQAPLSIPLLHECLQEERLLLPVSTGCRAVAIPHVMYRMPRACPSFE
jgi:hypothetical protein